MQIEFDKMHGLGNDFVIIDSRTAGLVINVEKIQKLSNRRLGVGCDQLIVLTEPRSADADVGMKIFNADGYEVEACGNASRCVAKKLSEAGVLNPKIETVAGILEAQIEPNELIKINMGQPKFNWKEIPLSSELSPASLNVSFDTINDPIAVNVGNPHIVFFVNSVDEVDMEKVGISLSKHALFPAGINIEVAHVIDYSTLRVRVYERGAGVTPACGSGACAAGVAAYKLGLTKRDVTVKLDGGDLLINSHEDGFVEMSGPATHVYSGTLSL